MKEVTVTAIAHALSRAFQSSSSTEFDTLKLLVILCGTGLLVSFAFLSYGLDLSPGFF
jgi:hypothetical protein